MSTYRPGVELAARQEKWDRVAESVLNGTLVPANGWDAWEESGILDSDRVAAIIPPNPATTLLEVGCGPGRMTRSLCLRYRKVIAVDVAPDMLNIIDRWASPVDAPVTTFLWHDPETPLPEADAAIAWHLADEDWTPQELQVVVEAMLRAAPFALFTSWHTWAPDVARKIAVATGNVEQATQTWALVSRAA